MSRKTFVHYRLFYACFQAESLYAGSGAVSVGTVLLWGEVVLLLEYPVEVGKVRDTDACCHLGDPHSCGQQEIGGYVQAVVVYVFDTGHAHILLEEAHEIVLAEVYSLRELLDSDGIHIVRTDVVEDHLDALGSTALDGAGVFLALEAVSEQQEEQIIKL